MTELIWISDWQIQCCGDEFAMGDVVTWPVVPTDESGGGWAGVLDHDLNAVIGGSYDGHWDEPPPMLTGAVRRIRTLSCQYAPSPPPHDPRELRPVPGTGVLGDVSAIEKWYGTGFDPSLLRFCGWLVDLEVSP